jgi:transcriptional regulator with XRE-family HTH domain
LNAIRRIREALGLTQVKFAQKIGRSYPSVQGYEAGKRVPREILEAVAVLAEEAGRADLAEELFHDLPETAAPLGRPAAVPEKPERAAGAVSRPPWAHRVEALESRLNALERLLESRLLGLEARMAATAGAGQALQQVPGVTIYRGGRRSSAPELTLIQTTLARLEATVGRLEQELSVLRGGTTERSRKLSGLGRGGEKIIGGGKR